MSPHIQDGSCTRVELPFDASNVGSLASVEFDFECSRLVGDRPEQPLQPVAFASASGSCVPSPELAFRGEQPTQRLPGVFDVFETRGAIGSHERGLGRAEECEGEHERHVVPLSKPWAPRGCS